MKPTLQHCIATFLAGLLIIGLVAREGEAARSLAPHEAMALQEQFEFLSQPQIVEPEPAEQPVLRSALVMSSRPQVASAQAREGSGPFEELLGQRRTVLADGRWLITGGESKSGVVDSAWIQDSSGFAAKLPWGLRHARAWHSATLLPDGTVLLFGGIGASGNAEANTELFRPETLSFEGVSFDVIARAHHTTTLLLDGRLLLAGGDGDARDVLEYVDSITKQSIKTSTLKTSRTGHDATLFADGTVHLWSGRSAAGLELTYGESIDPVTNFSRFELVQEDPGKNVPPRMETSIPANNATAVPVESRIALRFSSDLSPASVTPAAMVLSGSTGVVPTRSIPAEGKLVFVTPVSKLEQGTTYTLSIQGLLSEQGTAIPSTRLVFTTLGEGPDTKSKPKDANEDTSSAEHLPPLQAPLGQTALSGRALLLNGKPLQGVTFRIDEKRAKTDGTGRFLLKDLTPGHHELVIDGRTVGASDSYGVFEVGVDIVDGSTAILGYTVWMTPLDTAHAVNLQFPTANETVITTPLLRGLELHLPAGTTITDIDGKVATQVSITPISLTQPPFPLPLGVEVPIYFTIQPGGGYIHAYSSGQKRGARLIYPNTENSPAHSVYSFWNYDPEDKGWFVYGQGKVAADRKSIVPNPGVEIYELTGAMVAGPSGGPPSGGPSDGSNPVGDPVDPATGLFQYEKTDMAITDVFPISVTRTYRQGDSRSRAFGIGTSHNYDIFLVGDVAFYTYQELVLANGSRVRFDRVTPGAFAAGSVFKNTSSLGAFYGATITWKGSAVGWELVRKDGMIFRFPEAMFADPRVSAPYAIEDRNGNTVTITRDGSGNITRVTSPNGRYIDFTYTSNRITRLQDNAGRHVDYVYDPTGRLTQVTDANNGVWTYDYDAAHQMTGIHDARNILYLQNHYDANGRVDLQTQADNGTFQFNYTTDGNGRVTQTDVTDPRGHVRRLTFGDGVPSANGFIAGGYGTTDIFAYGTSLARTFTTQRQPGSNLPTSVTDPLGRVTTSTYDASGNVIGVTRLAGTANAVTTNFTYDATFGKVTSVTDPIGHTATFTYDSHGNLTTATDPLGNRASWTYNAAGQVLTATDGNRNVTTYGYTAGNLTSISDPMGRTASFTYDAVGRLLTTTTAYGTKSLEYNPLNLVTRITDPAAGITDRTFDPNGNLLTVKDARNNTTIYTYNNMDRLETRKDALLATESFVYDENGNLSQKTDRRGKVTTYSYDALDRLSFTGFGTQAGPTYESSITNTYDGGSRLAIAADSITGNVTRVYDDLDRLTSETTPSGTITYAYDNAGRRTSTTVTGQPAITYTHDDADRLTQITQAGATVGIAYDAGGRRTSLTLENGIVTNYNYDAASAVTELTYQSGYTTLGNLTYTYDQAGRRESFGGTFAKANLPAVLTSTNYNADNQLTSWNGTAQTYDANGNLTGDGTKTYTWNARNELSALGGAVTASFQYDAFGRRTTKTVGGNGTNYLYDGANVIQELSGTTPIANVLTGGTDEILRRMDGSGSSYFLADGLGSPIALSDATASIQTTYAYEAFGKTTSAGAANSNPYQYTGRENDGTGLYYYRARYYDPMRGRFVAEDPLEFNAGDTNLYGYAANAPTNATDPFGLTPILNLGSGWTARVDTPIYYNPEGFEIHVWRPNGDMAGIASGSMGWVGRHGFEAGVRPPGMTQEIANRVNGINVDELQRRGLLPNPHRRGAYLNGTRLSVLNFLHVILNEYNQWHELDVAGRKHNRTPDEEFCHRMEEAGNPLYYNTSLGPLPNPCGGPTI